MKANERLLLLRKELGYKQSEIAEILGIKQGSYSEIERGKVNLSNSIRTVLEGKLNVNIDWIYTGSGKKFLSNNSDSEDDSAKSNSLAHNLHIIIDGINELSKERTTLKNEIIYLKSKIKLLNDNLVSKEEIIISLKEKLEEPN